jgi:hypothetical protein
LQLAAVVAAEAAGVVEAAEAAEAVEAAQAAVGVAEVAEAGGGEAAGEAVAAACLGGPADIARHELIHVRRPRAGMAGVDRLDRGVWGSARQLRAWRLNG